MSPARAQAEALRRPLSLAIWEWWHGEARVTTHEEWREADRTLEALEATLATVDAELPRAHGDVDG